MDRPLPENFDDAFCDLCEAVENTNKTLAKLIRAHNKLKARVDRLTSENPTTE